MKTLLIMRHAKSDWTSDGLSDFERPLNERGKKAVPKIAKELIKLGLIPDLIISSTAERAKSTAEILIKNISYENEIIYIDEFYEALFYEMIKIIQNTSDNVQNLMIIGHNPTWEKLVTFLSKKEIFVEMPTAAVAIMTSNINSWKLFSEKLFILKTIIRPKELI